jgi:hypothetical protein
LDYLKIAHPGVKTSVGRGKPAIIRGYGRKLNAFRHLAAIIFVIAQPQHLVASVAEPDASLFLSFLIPELDTGVRHFVAIYPPSSALLICQPSFHAFALVFY